MSKAAQNMMTKCASIELKRKRVVCVALHPGTVQTTLSIPWQKNVTNRKLFTVEQSADYLYNVINNLQLKDTGK